MTDKSPLRQISLQHPNHNYSLAIIAIIRLLSKYDLKNISFRVSRMFFRKYDISYPLRWKSSLAPIGSPPLWMFLWRSMLTRSIDGSFIKLDLDFKSKLSRREPSVTYFLIKVSYFYQASAERGQRSSDGPHRPLGLEHPRYGLERERLRMKNFDNFGTRTVRRELGCPVGSTLPWADIKIFLRWNYWAWLHSVFW